MIISAYAPTLTTSDNNMEAFYENLNSLIKSTPASDKLTVLCDFNTRASNDSESWEGVLEPHGLGRINRNGLLLLTMYAASSLAITNTLFRLASKSKTTWMHPRSKQWHLTDYVITCRQDICNVKNTTAIREADHRLVRFSFFLHIAKHNQIGAPDWEGEVSVVSQ